MLLQLVNPNLEEPQYKECVNKFLMDLYYPEEKLKNRYNDLFPPSEIAEEKISSDSTKKELIKQTVAILLSSDDYGYPIIDNSTNYQFPFPYMNKYIEFFLMRSSKLSCAEYNQDPTEIFCLGDDPKGPMSMNLGNFFHFINVVMSLSRVIQYFTHSTSPAPKLRFFPRRLEDDFESEKLLFSYDQNGFARIFKLMLAGFYHDLGKTNIDQRHSIEGEILILADQTSASLYKLNIIFQKYKELQLIDKKENFERDDLTLLSKMILYHDQFGTLGTGEDGYLRLVKIVDLIKTLSLCRDFSHSDNTQQIIWSACTLFDLWVLNLADILASTNDIGKFVLQGDKLWYNKKISIQTISNFLNNSDHGTNISHDLKIALRLLHSHFHREKELKIHVSDSNKIMKEAVENSKFHTTERLRRLITSSLDRPVKSLIEKTKYERVGLFAKAIAKKLEEKKWIFTIERCLEVLGTSENFKNKFSWIGKMDYALSFFSLIAEKTLELVENELVDIVELHFKEPMEGRKTFINPEKIIISYKDGKIQDATLDKKFIPEVRDNKILLKLGIIDIQRSDLSKKEYYNVTYNGRLIEIDRVKVLPIQNTSWIRERTFVDIEDKGFITDLNAQFFIDNFTSTIITIISYLLNREKEIDTPKDFQFLYAKDRLNADKIRKITSMVGPFQTNKSVHYILQNIYIY